MEIGTVLHIHNPPREVLLEKACRLKQSIDDMLALWGDLQLEGRTLRAEGRRLNQQVAKLAEDSKRMLRNDGLIGESLKHFGYGDVVDAIRGSIVDAGTPSWTSGMVAAISASISEAAFQLLPHQDPRSSCGHKGRGRAGWRVEKKRFLSDEWQMHEKNGEELPPINGTTNRTCAELVVRSDPLNLRTDEQRIDSAHEILPRRCFGQFSSQSESETESSSKSIKMKRFAINKSDSSSDGHPSSRSTGDIPHKDRLRTTTSELTLALDGNNQRPCIFYSTNIANGDRDDNLSVACPQAAMATEIGGMMGGDPFSQNLLRRGSQLLEGSVTLANRSASIRGMVSKWMLSESDPQRTDENKLYPHTQCFPASGAFGLMELQMNLEPLESSEPTVRLMDEEEGEIAIQIETALGLQLETPATACNRKLFPIRRKPCQRASVNQSFEFVMPVVKDDDKQHRKRLKKMNRRTRRVEKRSDSFETEKSRNCEIFNCNIDSTIDSIIENSKGNMVGSKMDSTIAHNIDTEEDSASTMNSKIESRIESRMESKIESGIEREIDRKIDSKIDSRIDSTIDSKTENRIDSTIDSKIENKVDSTIDSKTENKVDSTIDSKTESRIDSTIDSTIENSKGNNMRGNRKRNPLKKSKKETALPSSRNDGKRKNRVSVAGRRNERWPHEQQLEATQLCSNLCSKTILEKSKSDSRSDLLNQNHDSIGCGSTTMVSPMMRHASAAILPSPRPLTFDLLHLDNVDSVGSSAVTANHIYEEEASCQDSEKVKGQQRDSPLLAANSGGMQTACMLASAQSHETESSSSTECPSVNQATEHFSTGLSSPSPPTVLDINSVSVRPSISPLSLTPNDVSDKIEIFTVALTEMPIDTPADCDSVDPMALPVSRPCSLNEFSGSPYSRFDASSTQPDFVDSDSTDLPQSSLQSNGERLSSVTTRLRQPASGSERQPTLRTSRFVRLSISPSESKIVKISGTFDFRRFLHELIDLGRRQFHEERKRKTGTKSCQPLTQRKYKTDGLDVTLGLLSIYFAVLCDPVQANGETPKCLLSQPVSFSVSNKAPCRVTHVVSLSQFLASPPSILNVVVYGTPSEMTLVSDEVYASKKEKEWLRLGIKRAMAGDVDPISLRVLPLLRVGMKIDVSEDSVLGFSVKKLTDFEPPLALWRGGPLTHPPASGEQHSSEEKAPSHLMNKEAQLSITADRFESQNGNPPVEPLRCHPTPFCTISTIVESLAATEKSSEECLPSGDVNAASEASEYFSNKQNVTQASTQTLLTVIPEQDSRDAIETTRSVSPQNSNLPLDASLFSKQLPAQPENKSAILTCQSKPEKYVAKVSLPDDRFFDDLRRFDALGVTGVFTDKRKAATALNTRLVNCASIPSISSRAKNVVVATATPYPQDAVVTLSPRSSRLEKAKDRKGGIESAPNQPQQQQKNISNINSLAPFPLINEELAETGLSLLPSSAKSSQKSSRATSPKTSQHSSRKSPTSFSIDVTHRMIRANDLHRRLLSKIRSHDDGSRIPAVAASSSDGQCQIPRIGGHRELEQESEQRQHRDLRSRTQESSTPQHQQNKEVESPIPKEIFVIRIQIDDNSHYEELRLTDNSNIHDRCRQFLHRHNIKTVFQSGLESVANNFIAEMKYAPSLKVFHQRLQSDVFLKTIDIADLPIE